MKTEIHNRGQLIFKIECEKVADLKTDLDHTEKFQPSDMVFAVYEYEKDTNEIWKLKGVYGTKSEAMEQLEN